HGRAMADPCGRRRSRCRSRQSPRRARRWSGLSALKFLRRRFMATVSVSGANLAVAEVLRIAHQDAQAVYRDLSGFKITLTPCPDGWHVDYDLTDPLS